MGCAGDLLHWEGGIWVFFHCTSDWVCRDPRDAQCFYLWSGSRNCLAAADRSWCVTKWLRERQIKQYSQRQIPVFPVPSGSMEPSFGQHDLCMLLRECRCGKNFAKQNLLKVKEDRLGCSLGGTVLKCHGSSLPPDKWPWVLMHFGVSVADCYHEARNWQNPTPPF